MARHSLWPKGLTGRVILVLVLAGQAVLARHGRRLRLLLEELARSARCALAARLCHLVLVLPR